MAGFAVNMELIRRHENATFLYAPGYQEDYFLQALQIKRGEIEVKASNCTEILVWHTKAAEVKRKQLQIPMQIFGRTSIEDLLNWMSENNIISLTPNGKFHLAQLHIC